MRVSIVRSGNSKAIRIPKTWIEEIGLGNVAELSLYGDRITIKAVEENIIDGGIVLARPVLAKQWDTDAEDEAWAYLQ